MLAWSTSRSRGGHRHRHCPTNPSRGGRWKAMKRRGWRGGDEAEKWRVGRGWGGAPAAAVVRLASGAAREIAVASPLRNERSCRGVTRAVRREGELPGVRWRWWLHMCIDRYWVGSNPIPVEPNAFFRQDGKDTPTWARLPTRWGFDPYTCRYTRCQTKPKGVPKAGEMERCLITIVGHLQQHGRVVSRGHSEMPSHSAAVNFPDPAPEVKSSPTIDIVI
jgi:hypothetical protein